MSRRTFLRALADEAGILSSYVDVSGRTRRASDATRVALLKAVGIDAGSEAAARDCLEGWRARRAAEILPATRVAGAAAARRVVASPGAREVRTWCAEVECEDGQRLAASGRVRRGAARAMVLPPLPLGYHRLRLVLGGPDGEERSAEQHLIVVPRRCLTPGEKLGKSSVFGILANLYSVRSSSNWGCGDLTDLRRLVEWAGSIGAAFAGINPLHALENRGDQISPYSPVSRLYRNVLYLDVTAAPEWAELPAARRAELAGEEVLGPLRAAPRIDYGAVRALKEPVFAALHRVFVERHRDRDTERGQAYARYLQAEGEALRDFATFLVMQGRFESQGIGSWRRWPAAYRDPRGRAVEELRAAEREAVDRHCYLQFEFSRQLGVAAETGRSIGMAVGVYQDLALGSSRRGSDPWAFPGLFLDRASIGAPPDDYSPTGQNWQLPPLNPHALAASGYAYWARLLRAALQHAGALRIDHVMGLLRQFWIPSGGTGRDGAYMRFPAEDLFGILALESHRAGALVIGEDLGTVPPGIPALLARWGVLSTRVLYFERTRGGAFRPARAYPSRALVGANTHDLVPLAGFWEGRDLALRRRMRLIRTDRELVRATAERERERKGLVALLRREGALAPRAAATDSTELTAAVHSFLSRTPAVLVGASLDDLTGERTPVNLPGVSLARYPSWSRRMQLPLESLATDPGVIQALDGLPAVRGRAGKKERGGSPVGANKAQR